MAEIGDRIPSAQDVAYQNYADFVRRLYGREPMSYERWSRAESTSCNFSAAKLETHRAGGFTLKNPTEHKRAKAAHAENRRASISGELI
jgi:hypothetical protein